MNVLMFLCVNRGTRCPVLIFRNWRLKKKTWLVHGWTKPLAKHGSLCKTSGCVVPPITFPCEWLWKSPACHLILSKLANDFRVMSSSPPLLSPRCQHHHLRHASTARMRIQVVAEVGATAATQVQHLSLLSLLPFYTLWWTNIAIENGPVEIVVIFPLIAWWFSMAKCDSSPEGKGQSDAIWGIFLIFWGRWGDLHILWVSFIRKKPGTWPLMPFRSSQRAGWK